MCLPGAAFFIRNNQFFRVGKWERWGGGCAAALWPFDRHRHWQILINVLGGACRETQWRVITLSPPSRIPLLSHVRDSRGKIKLTANCSCFGEERERGREKRDRQTRGKWKRRGGEKKRRSHFFCWPSLVSGRVFVLLGVQAPLRRTALVSAAAF